MANPKLAQMFESNRTVSHNFLNNLSEKDRKVVAALTQAMTTATGSSLPNDGELRCLRKPVASSSVARWLA